MVSSNWKFVDKLIEKIRIAFESQRYLQKKVCFNCLAKICK